MIQVTPAGKPERKWSRFWFFLLLAICTMLAVAEWPLIWKADTERYVCAYNSGLLVAGVCLVCASFRIRCYSRPFLIFSAVVGFAVVASALISSGCYLQYQRHIFKSGSYASPHEMAVAIAAAKERLELLRPAMNENEITDFLGLAKYLRFFDGRGPWDHYHSTWFLDEGHTLTFITDKEHNLTLRVSIDGDGRDLQIRKSNQ